MIQIANAVSNLNNRINQTETRLRYLKKVHDFIRDLDLETNPYRQNCFSNTPIDVKVEVEQVRSFDGAVRFTITRAAFGTEIKASFFINEAQVERPEMMYKTDDLAKAYHLFYNEKLRVPNAVPQEDPLV